MRATEQLTVELPSELAAALRGAVQSGAFSSESEVLETILWAWHGDNTIEEPDFETLRAFMAKGIADAEAGRFVDAYEMFARLRARYNAVASDRSSG
jgi:antitoxin ParD1/3/4